MDGFYENAEDGPALLYALDTFDDKFLSQSFFESLDSLSPRSIFALNHGSGALDAQHASEAWHQPPQPPWHSEHRTDTLGTASSDEQPPCHPFLFQLPSFGAERPARRPLAVAPPDSLPAPAHPSHHTGIPQSITQQQPHTHDWLGTPHGATPGGTTTGWTSGGAHAGHISSASLAHQAAGRIDMLSQSQLQCIADAIAIMAGNAGSMAVAAQTMAVAAVVTQQQQQQQTGLQTSAELSSRQASHEASNESRWDPATSCQPAPSYDVTTSLQPPPSRGATASHHLPPFSCAMPPPPSAAHHPSHELYTPRSAGGTVPLPSGGTSGTAGVLDVPRSTVPGKRNIADASVGPAPSAPHSWRHSSQALGNSTHHPPAHANPTAAAAAVTAAVAAAAAADRYLHAGMSQQHAMVTAASTDLEQLIQQTQHQHQQHQLLQRLSANHAGGATIVGGAAACQPQQQPSSQPDTVQQLLQPLLADEAGPPPVRPTAAPMLTGGVVGISRMGSKAQYRDDGDSLFKPEASDATAVWVASLSRRQVKEQLASLSVMLSETQGMLSGLQRDNTALRGRERVLGLVNEVRREQIERLSRPATNQLLYDVCLNVTRHHERREHLMGRVVEKAWKIGAPEWLALFGCVVDELSRCLLTESAGPSPVERILSVMDSIKLVYQELFVRCTTDFLKMCTLSVEGGVVPPPDDALWLLQCQSINLSPQQAADISHLNDLYCAWSGAILRQRRRLSEALDATLPGGGNRGGGTDPTAPDAAELVEALYRNLVQERCLLALVDEVLVYKLLNPIQLAMMVVITYPHPGDICITLHSIASYHAGRRYETALPSAAAEAAVINAMIASSICD